MHYRECERGDPLLVQVVEELGEEANGPCSSLVLVEVPDDVVVEINDHPLQKGFLVEHHSPTYGWNTLEDVFELPLTSTVIENINFRGDYSGVNPIGEVLHVQGGYEYYLSFPYGMRRVQPDPQLHIKAFVCGLMRKGVPCQVIFLGDICTFGYIP